MTALAARAVVEVGEAAAEARDRVLLDVRVAVQVDLGQRGGHVGEEAAGLGGEGRVHEAEVAVGRGGELRDEVGAVGEAGVLRDRPRGRRRPSPGRRGEPGRGTGLPTSSLDHRRIRVDLSSRPAVPPTRPDPSGAGRRDRLRAAWRTGATRCGSTPGRRSTRAPSSSARRTRPSPSTSGSRRPPGPRSGPPAAPPPRRIAFVDGVRRIEHRLLVGDGERTVFGLLGSFGVGAVLVDGAARVEHETIGRVAVTGGGLKLDPFEAPVDGRGALRLRAALGGGEHPRRPGGRAAEGDAPHRGRPRRAALRRGGRRLPRRPPHLPDRRRGRQRRRLRQAPPPQLPRPLGARAAAPARGGGAHAALPHPRPGAALLVVRCGSPAGGRSSRP